MNETPTYVPQTPLVQNLPPQSPPTQRKTTQLPLIVALILLLVVIVGAGLYWHRHQQASSAGSPSPSLTLYYSDGKTVLWQSPNSVASSPAPELVSYVQAQLHTDYGSNFMNKGSWAVTTTLNKSLQAAAEQVIKNQEVTLRGQGVGKAMFIGENVTNGHIESWVGSTINQSNTDDLQQLTNVGSLQLSFTYAAYLANTPGSSVNSTFDDAQMPLPGWPCTNKDFASGQANCLFDEDHLYLGPLSLYQALAKGRNVPAVEATNAIGGSNAPPMTGINKVIATANNVGSDGACYQPGSASFTKQTQTQCYDSAAIGDGLLATPQHTLQAYATLANGGNKLPQTVILKTTLNGKTVYAWAQQEATSVLSSKIAMDLEGVLSDANSCWLQTNKAMFTTKGGTKTAIAYGGSNSTATGDVQFTSTFAAIFWVEGQKLVNPSGASDGEALQGTLSSSMQTITTPITYDWFNAAE